MELGRFLEGLGKEVPAHYGVDDEVTGLVGRVKAENQMVLLDVEACQLFMAVKKTGKIDGDIAEVGVYQGGSAKLICEAKGSKALHLFDTFEGLPCPDSHDAGFLVKGVFAARLEDVRNYLREYPDVHFYKGLCPDTAEPLHGRLFSFVHLDVDLYESTLNCLKFFYPRMNRGGIIFSHDYRMLPGVTEAIDSFFEDKREAVIELCGTQCLIVRL